MKVEKLAYIVSIEEYQMQRLPKVAFAKNDATAIEQMFKKTFGLEDHQIKTFINSDVTHATFENEISYELKNLEPGTEFYFYYAGHGFHDGNQNWLTCWDTHIHSLEKTSIALQDAILTPVSKSDCKSALLFLDTCSKNMIETFKTRTAIQNFKFESLSDFVNTEKYRAIFASCSPGEAAYPSMELQHGIWTSFLLKALNGEAPEPLNENLEITGDSLKRYLLDSVKKYIREKTDYKRQTPYATLSSADKFIIAKYKEQELSLPDSVVHLDPNIEKQFFRSKSSIAFKKHPNFDKKKGHFEPKDLLQSAARWASDLKAEEIKEEIKEVYENCVSNLKIKRSALKKSDTTLDCDLFRLSITSTQDPQDYTKILTTRKLRISDSFQKLPNDFDSIFPVKPDEFVVPFKNHPDHSELLKVFEDLEDKTDGSISEDEDEGYIQIVTPDKLCLRIDTESCEIIFSSYGLKGVQALMPVINSQLKALGFSDSLSINTESKTRIITSNNNSIKKNSKKDVQ